MNYIGLDLSTHTGFVKLSPDGKVLEQKEINEPCDTPESMWNMWVNIFKKIEAGDVVAIENFGFGSQQGFQLGGIGWIVRVGLWNAKQQFHLVAPTSLKKFASGKGTLKKDSLAVEIYKRWVYEHPSDYVRDAFVVAQIARSLHEQVDLTKFQQEVLDTIQNKKPKEKKARKKHEQN